MERDGGVWGVIFRVERESSRGGGGGAYFWEGHIWLHAENLSDIHYLYE